MHNFRCPPAWYRAVVRLFATYFLYTYYFTFLFWIFFIFILLLAPSQIWCDCKSRCCTYTIHNYTRETKTTNKHYLHIHLDIAMICTNHTHTHTHTNTLSPTTHLKIKLHFFFLPQIYNILFTYPQKVNAARQNYLNLIKNIVFVFSLSLFFPTRVSFLCLSRREYLGKQLEKETEVKSGAAPISGKA